VDVGCNIESHKTAERAIARERRHLETILRITSDGIYILDANGLLIEANGAFLNVIGYDKTAIGRLHIADWDTLFGEDVHRKRINAMIRDKATLKFETRHKTRDGKIIDVEVNARGIEVEGQAYVYAASRVRNHRHHFDAAPHEIEIRYQALFGNMTEGVALHELVNGHDGRPTNYRILAVNPAYALHTGLAAEQTVGKLATDAYGTPEAPYLETFARVVKSRQPTEFETYFAPMGRHFRVRAHATTDTRFATIFEDITDRKRSEVALAESHCLLQTIIDTAPISIFWKDLNLRYLGCNQTFAKYNGKAHPDEVVGKDDYQLAGPEHADRYRADDRSVMESGIPRLFYEEPLNTPDGETIWLSTCKVPLRNRNNETIGVLGIYEDITERRRTEGLLRESEARYRSLADNSIDWIWVMNVGGRHTYSNNRVLDYFGLEREAFLKIDPMALIHPDDQSLYASTFQHALATRSGWRNVQIRWRAKDGSYRTVESSASPMLDAKERLVGFQGIDRDVTDRLQAEVTKRLSASVFANSYEGFFFTDAQNVIVDVNPAFTRITGYTREEVIGKSPKLLASDRQGPEFYARIRKSLREHDFWNGEIWNRRKNGEVYAEILAISAVRDSAGQLQHYVGIFSDISQLKAHEAELERIAYYDSLTGVPNRRLLADRLRQAVARSRRSSSSLAVCYLDLDGFKPINDRYGHAAGDQLLVIITERLKQLLRADDTVARLGGDEFVLLFTDLANAEESHPILERVLAAISVPVQIETTEICVSASIGVTIYPADESDADTLLRHADQAMYCVKEAGKNRYQLFNPHLDQRVTSKREELERIQQGLVAGQFCLYFQPKVEFDRNTVAGAEALIRWQHPVDGLLEPAEFLAIVEDEDLALDMGAWVIGEALRHMENWRREGIDLQISINTFARQLHRADFAANLEQKLAEYPDVPPSRLQIEITETGSLSELLEVQGIIANCRQLGIGFSIADFGTGYSSLTYLRHLAATELKIHQRFVRGMLINPEDQNIVEGIIALGRALRRSIVAEGVETTEQIHRLQQLGCALMQGYSIARPMSPQQLAIWVQEFQAAAGPPH
jgi:diguanylate cyclase (GGDEF)-like protein/PAS domain S-box-containing protein